MGFRAPLGDLHVSVENFVRPDVIAQLGLAPYRIDVMTSISGVDFDEAWAERINGEIEGVRVPVLGLKAFVRNKRASGRTKDVADLEALGEA